MHRLKCKIGSLAAEARFTHNYERREMREARRISAKYGSAEQVDPRRRVRALQMRMHRIGPVRSEARHSQLAYAFLRGKKYLLTERKLKVDRDGLYINPPDWDAIEKIALRFTVDDERDAKQRFAEWKDAGLTRSEMTRLRRIDKAAAKVIAKKRAEAKAMRASFRKALDTSIA